MLEESVSNILFLVNLILGLAIGVIIGLIEASYKGELILHRNG
jgi:ABC-type dipeptide/oligopeptide/nickel transport system permease component